MCRFFIEMPGQFRKQKTSNCHNLLKSFHIINEQKNFYIYMVIVKLKFTIRPKQKQQF